MDTPGEQTTAGPLVTRLEKRWWLYRMVPLAVFFGLFSLWGLYDATVAYPARGREVADSYLLEVLRMKFDQPAWRTADVGTSDPGAEFARLSERLESGSPSEFDRARHRWLEALQRINALDTAHTVIADPAARRQELETAFAALPPNRRAKPLSTWDIPAQWLIFAGCAAVALYMVALLLMVARRKYTWDPGAMRLGLPGNHSLVPSDITEFDKRKWHKFIIFLRVRPDHPTLAGRTVKLDLYCHTGLESWILEMEKAAGPAAGEAPVADTATA